VLLYPCLFCDLRNGGLSAQSPDQFTPGKDKQYPSYRRLGWPWPTLDPHGEESVSFSPRQFEPRTVASRCSDYAIRIVSNIQICNANKKVYRQWHLYATMCFKTQLRFGVTCIIGLTIFMYTIFHMRKSRGPAFRRPTESLSAFHIHVRGLEL